MINLYRLNVRSVRRMIDDSKLYIFTRDWFKCQHPDCNIRGIGNLEVAHRIAKGEKSAKNNVNRDYVIRFWYQNFNEMITKKYACDVILNHPLNMVTSCREHNDYFNIAGRPQEMDELLRKIYEDLVRHAK